MKDVVDKEGQIIKYETFINTLQFPITFKEYQSITQCIPHGLRILMKDRQEIHLPVNNKLYINGIELLNCNCNNGHIRNSMLQKKIIQPKFYWESVFGNIQWETTWTLPLKYCIYNKIREVHYRILHRYYPVNELVAKFKDTDPNCCFCQISPENITHLFFTCSTSQKLWQDIKTFLSQKLSTTIYINFANIITGYKNQNKKIELITNLFILIGKYHIHEAKFAQSKPLFKLFLFELKVYVETLKHIINKKATHFVNVYEELMS